MPEYSEFQRSFELMNHQRRRSVLSSRLLTIFTKLVLNNNILFFDIRNLIWKVTKAYSTTNFNKCFEENKIVNYFQSVLIKLNY